MKKHLFIIADWLLVFLVLAFLFLPLSERSVGTGDPEYWPILVALIFPFNGGPITVIIGILMGICGALFLTFHIIFQINKKMQLGILITTFILLVFYAYIGHDGIFVIPAVITGLSFLLQWTDFFVKKSAHKNKD